MVYVRSALDREESSVEAPADLVAFIEREQPRLIRAANLLVGDRAVAEEIAQEALLRTASRWEKVRSLGSPGGWTHRVTVNLATSQLRRRRVERRARARMAGHEVSTQPPGSPVDIAVRDALATLPTASQRTLVLHHVLGWTAVEIGDLDGATADAVRQRLHRAREALRAALGPGFVTDQDAQTDRPTGSVPHEQPARSGRMTSPVRGEENTDVR